jgi:hypothetical protein
MVRIERMQRIPLMDWRLESISEIRSIRSILTMS